MHEFGSSTATSLCWLVSYLPLATLGARPPVIQAVRVHRSLKEVAALP